MLRDVTKDYPGVRALAAVTMSVASRSVLGLVGQNGSGKSTLLRLVEGGAPPDSGSIEIFGQDATGATTADVRGLGVGIVHQDARVFPALSVLENVFAGRQWSKYGVASRRSMHESFQRLCEQWNIELDPKMLAGGCSIAERMSIELARALQQDAQLLLLDEPTAALGHAERLRFHAIIERLKADGRTVVFVSHDLDEIVKLCDRVCVLRDGRLTFDSDGESTTTQELVDEMVTEGVTLASTTAQHVRGGPVSGAYPRAPRVDGSPVLGAMSEAALEVRGLSVPGTLKNVSLAVGHGEILGVAGLVGSGRSTLLRALIGLERCTVTQFRLDGVDRRLPTSPAAALRLGIGIVPEDRRGQALLPNLSGYENVACTSFRSVARHGVVRPHLLRRRALEILERVGFKGLPSMPPLTFSGGNQQKMVIGRWLHHLPRVLLVDEPTRGIDVGAKIEIISLLEEICQTTGLAVIWVSSELEEVVNTADRIVLLARGESIGELSGDERRVDTILHRLFVAESAGRGSATNSGVQE